MTVPRVFADANVLFSRVLRDYLMYSALNGVIVLRWSGMVLAELERNLVARGKMDRGRAQRLCELMVSALPCASVDPNGADLAALDGVSLPDEGDRHVLAAAIVSESNFLCTSNTRAFPIDQIGLSGLSVVSPDALFEMLLRSAPILMLRVHEEFVGHILHGSSAETLKALARAGAPGAAAVLRVLTD